MDHPLDILLDVVLSTGQSCGPRAGPCGACTSFFQTVHWVLALPFPAPVILTLLPGPRWALPQVHLPKEGRLCRPWAVCAPVGPGPMTWVGPGDGEMG